MTKWRLGAVLGIALALVAVAGLEAVSYHYRFRIDLTGGKFHSLAPQSKQVLQNLPDPVEAIGFYAEGDNRRHYAEGLLKTYALASARFSYRFLDADRNPAQAKRFGVRTNSVVVLVSGGRYQLVPVVDEQSLTNALVRLTSKKEKRVLFTTGHGEGGPDQSDRTGYARAATELRSQGYQVGRVNLLTAEKIDPGTAIAIAGPTGNFAPEEVKRLAELAKAGGRLLVMLDPNSDAGLTAFLLRFGIEPQANIVIDRAARLLGTAMTMAVVTAYPPHDITRGFEMMSLFPQARSLRLVKGWPDNLAVTPLALTGQTAWGETDIPRLLRGEAEQGQDDVKGPVLLAVTAQAVPGVAAKNSPAGPGFRLAVFGDSDFAANAHLNQAGNRDLFLNTVAWLIEDDTGITIRPSSERFQPALLGQREGRLIFWLPVVGLPGLILLIGLVVVIRRWRRA